MGIGQTRPARSPHWKHQGCERDVFAHSSAERERVLGNNADLTAQGIKLNLSNVVAIDQDATFLVVEPAAASSGALAAATLTDDAHKGS